ncbi:MAG: 7-carboxy-7-deazaguanine synthase QueE [Flavobacteriales bacterium]|nr:7-carboxy-7-deazaguanine synthase QueE [Flavobacteriales bacterium]
MKIEGVTEGMKQQLKDGLSLPIMEQFYTLQGEGFHTGKAAYFIRIGGCDVGCRWCDVKESWDARIHPLVETAKVVQEASQLPSKTVVITGGEPLLFNLSALTKGLHDSNCKVHLETCGAHPLTGEYDWVCLSPKKNAPPRQEFYGFADELKIIVHNRHDFEWATQHASLVNESCKLFLQPEWSKNNEVMPLIVEYIMKYPMWSISLQSHKYMNIP